MADQRILQSMNQKVIHLMLSAILISKDGLAEQTTLTPTPCLLIFGLSFRTRVIGSGHEYILRDISWDYTGYGVSVICSSSKLVRVCTDITCNVFWAMIVYEYEF